MSRTKKWAAFLVAALLVFQAVPAFMDGTISTGINLSGVAFRDALDIGSDERVNALAGSQITLTANENYAPVWTSSDLEKATVNTDGPAHSVTVSIADHATGDVDITATVEEQTRTLRIYIENPGDYQDGQSNAEGLQNIVIMVTGKTEAITYDGQEHTLAANPEAYDLSSNNSNFKPELVSLAEEKSIAKTDGGLYPLGLTGEDFKYNDNTVKATFIIKDAYLKINAKKVTIKPNDAEKRAGEPDPELTATVSGMVDGESEDLLKYRLERAEGDEPGEYTIKVVNADENGSNPQGNYRINFDAVGKFTILNAWLEQPLYNLAKIKDKWYKLAKTEFLVAKPIGEYLKGVTKDGTNITLQPDEYIADDYDFANQRIIVNNKQYAHISQKSDDLNVDGYYTATLNTVETLTAVKNKIGGGGGFIVPAEQQYGYKNETDSFHRNYTIELLDNVNVEKWHEYELYNEININGKYYRLRKTKIQVSEADKKDVGKPVNSANYAMSWYDFTGVELEVNGETYVYSAKPLSDETVSYYTVSLENIKYELRIHQDPTWINYEPAWLDGSKAQFGNEENETAGYHANYKATFHKGKKPPKEVTITNDWPEGKTAYAGAVITLTATLKGFGDNYTLTWQHSTDQRNWVDVQGTDPKSLTYTYILDETTAQYYWRVVANE